MDKIEEILARGVEKVYPSREALEKILKSVDEYIKKTNRQEFLITIQTPTAVAELQTYYFPGWKIWVDDKQVKIDPSRDKVLGRMQIDLTPGKHQVLARFTATPVRTIGNTLSLIAWVALVCHWWSRRPFVRGR